MAKSIKELTKQEYVMDTGGGEPIPAGMKMTDQHRVDQPKDPKTGQFLSNGAADLPTEYPGRGKHDSALERLGWKVAKKSGKEYIIDPNNKMFKLPPAFKTVKDFYKALMQYDPISKTYGGALREIPLKGIGGTTSKDKTAAFKELFEGKTIWEEYKQYGKPTYANHSQYDEVYKKVKGDYHFKGDRRNWKTLIESAAWFDKNREALKEKLDVDLAKSDPEKFKADNKFALDYIVGTANHKAEDGDEKWTIDDVVSIIAESEIGSFKELDDYLNEYKAE